MIETHPFGDFVPKNTRYLILGSFTAKEAYDDKKKTTYLWFYANSGRNQFWPILETVYRSHLSTRGEMQTLLTKLKMAMADIILTCERKKNSNLDTSLTNLTFNRFGLEQILTQNPIEKIFFTSQFVEVNYRRYFKDLLEKFPDIELVTLPSPSPRYATMRFADKVKAYSDLLPKPKCKPTSHPHRLKSQLLASQA